MPIAIAHEQRFARVFEMVVGMAGCVNVTVQRAAERDVHLLKTATDAEQRHAAVGCAAHQFERDMIAVRIDEHGVIGRSAVLARFDVRRPARKQQAAEAVEIVRYGFDIARRRNQDRIHARTRDQRTDVALLRAMQIMLADKKAVAHHSDKRLHCVAPFRSNALSWASFNVSFAPLASSLRASMCSCGRLMLSTAMSPSSRK